LWWETDTLFNIENLVLRVRSEFDGFAGKDCELMKSQISSTKLQTNLKFQ